MIQKLDKPLYGQPCNNCGGCCIEMLCPLAELIFELDAGPCPALRQNGDGFLCGLVVAPADFAPVQALLHGREAMGSAAALLVGAGKGCDAKLEGEPDDPGFRKKLRKSTRDRALARRLDLAAELWEIGFAREGRP